MAAGVGFGQSIFPSAGQRLRHHRSHRPHVFLSRPPLRIVLLAPSSALIFTASFRRPPAVRRSPSPPPCSSHGSPTYSGRGAD
jgi:hypothetical protein